MKKLISALIIGAMLTMQAGVFASGTAYTMTDALSEVKQKASVPESLTEFTSRTAKNSDGKTSYTFSWQNEDSSQALEIQCDERGRIDRYYKWEDYDASAKSVRLTGYTKSDALSLAEDFLKQLIPEAFTETDTFLYSEEDSRGVIRDSGTSFSFTFLRTHNGIEVNGNRAYVYILAKKDGMTVQSANIDYNYDAVFEACDNVIADADDAYKTAYPAKLYYIKDYEKSEDKKPDATKAVYKLDEYGAGYISAATGEKITEYQQPYSYEMAADSALKESVTSNAGGGGSINLTPQERKEIENVQGLKKEAEIEKLLRSYPELKMTDKMLLCSSSVYKSNDSYMMNLHFSDEEKRYMYVTLDAKTGEIRNIDNHMYSNDEYTATDEEKNVAETKAKAFFEKLAPEISAEYQTDKLTSHSHNVDLSMYRYVNGAAYLSNTAHISYNIKEDMITRYSVSYTAAEFADITNAIGEDAAYDGLLSKYPLKQVYVLTDKNSYSLCYTTTKPYTDIDAFTGEPVIEEAALSGKYTDISGHWCENAVTRLAEVGICLSGDTFRPDEAITKGDLLTYFAAGLKDDGYIRYGLAEVLASMKRWNVIDLEAEDADLPVSREDACVYMVRLAGYEKVARLSNIFTVHFEDEASISPEKMGYAAILSGFGVVSGNDGNLRPQDNLTRAEAAAMLYTFLMND